MKKLGVGALTALALGALMLFLFLTPVVPKPAPIERKPVDVAALLRKLEALASSLPTSVRTNEKKPRVLVVITSPTAIAISGTELHGRVIRVSSAEDFARVIGTFQGPGTALVGFGPENGPGRGLAFMNPPVGVEPLRSRLRTILAEHGFSDPLTDPETAEFLRKAEDAMRSSP